MAEGLNECRFIGNLGDTASLRYTQSQQAVLSFRIACTERYLDNNTKEWKERTEWVPVVIFGKRAESLNRFLAKGSKVHVSGRFQTRSWEDKQGGKRYTTEIIASDIILLGGGPRRDTADHAADGGTHTDADMPPDDSGEIPF
jgi:single-strand DNA-binding protein